jgi:hypothetical protein
MTASRAPSSSSVVKRLGAARKGRVLAVKWGYNPNSSSLGVDVTFLLFGLFIITLLTPTVGLLLRWQARRRAPGRGAGAPGI